MGRRPDALVNEFFERGQKLGDSSNRYQHLCKRCGEVFPKGRVESLIGHLLRRCPNVTPEDRELVVAQYQQNPEPHKISGKKRRRSKDEPFGLYHHDARADPTTLPTHRDPQQSALDTLAEVSRRHLDYSSHRLLPDQAQESEQQALGQLLAEQALIAELHQHNQSLDHAGTEPEEFGLGNPNVVSAANDVINHAEPSMPASGLMQTASAANQELEYTQSRTQSQPASAVDPQLQQMSWLPQPEKEHCNTANPDEITMECSTASISHAPSADNPQTLANSPVQGKEPTPGFGILQRPSKSNVRNKFNDERRKEVHGIRKQGACMRCRMLKKPCSEGTPCNSCRSIDSARVWKNTCIRSRLSEECALWSTGLFGARRDVAMVSLAVEPASVVLPRHLEARFSMTSELRMTLPGQLMSRSTILDPSAYDTLCESGGGSRLVWLSDKKGLMQQALELYVNQITDSHIEAVGSRFMKATLQQARTYAREAEVRSTTASQSGHSNRRSGYNLQNQLLDTTIELWILNDILTSPEQQSLQIYHVSSPDPQQLTSMSEQLDNPTPAASIPNDRCRLVRAQLLVAAEARCNTLSKAVMNELERRLLQRKQVSRFATFLSAVILLNCVERMSGYYRSMDVESCNDLHEANGASIAEHAQTQESELPTDNDPTTTQPTGSRTTPPSWPLQQPPSHFWPQGSHFATLLITLLCIRALPPSLTKTSSGTIAALKEDFGFPSHPNSGRRVISIKDPVDQPTKEAAEWLDPLELHVEDLIDIRDRETPTPEMGPEGWDLRFISRLLLPGSM